MGKKNDSKNDEALKGKKYEKELRRLQAELHFAPAQHDSVQEGATREGAFAEAFGKGKLRRQGIAQRA